MSTKVEMLQQPLASLGVSRAEWLEQADSIRTEKSWDLEAFAEQQIRGLVQQVFLSGWPKPARYVGFSSIGRDAQADFNCIRVARELARQVSGRVCVVRTDPRSSELRANLSCRSEVGNISTSATVADEARQVDDNLWVIPVENFVSHLEVISDATLSERLSEVRSQFEYGVIQAPPARVPSELMSLGRFCDGIILVLEAESTRRIAALQFKRMLQEGNVRLLGTVLDQRRFPIPESIYRKL